MARQKKSAVKQSAAKRKPSPKKAGAQKKATRKKLAAHVAQRTGISQRLAYVMVDEVLSGIGSALAAGGTVELRYFGTFWLNERAARTIKVPNVGAVKVGKRLDVMFRPGRPLEALVRKKLGKRRTSTKGK